MPFFLQNGLPQMSHLLCDLMCLIILPILSNFVGFKQSRHWNLESDVSVNIFSALFSFEKSQKSDILSLDMIVGDNQSGSN
jgi:hypothetical protein